MYRLLEEVSSFTRMVRGAGTGGGGDFGELIACSLAVVVVVGCGLFTGVVIDVEVRTAVAVGVSVVSTFDGGFSCTAGFLTLGVCLAFLYRFYCIR